MSLNDLNPSELQGLILLLKNQPALPLDLADVPSKLEEALKSQLSPAKVSFSPSHSKPFLNSS